MALLLISFEHSYGYVNIDILRSLIIWCFLMISSRSCGRTVGVLCWLISLKLVGRISERLSLALIDVDHFEPIGNLLHMLSLMSCMLSWREEIAFSDALDCHLELLMIFSQRNENLFPKRFNPRRLFHPSHAHQAGEGNNLSMGDILDPMLHARGIDPKSVRRSYWWEIHVSR